MPDGLDNGDPLTPAEREEFEEDLVAFCDRALDLLGDISGLRVLYAGGAAPLWLEGLAERIGAGGSLTALEADAEKVEASRRRLADAGLPCTVSVVTGDVFFPPFAPGTFDLAYSAGLLHELDVSRGPAEEAIRALAATLRPGGRLATDDFVDSVSAAQVEDEALEGEIRRTLRGEEPYGIGSPGRLITLYEEALDAVSSHTLPPFAIRHLDRLSLAEPQPEGMNEDLHRRRLALHERVRREGYTRPATLYVEGRRLG